MNHYTREDIENMIEDEDVEFIRLQFVDVFGVLKNIAVTARQIDKVLNNQCVINVSAIEGMIHGKGTTMYLVPDLDTFEIFPWRPQQGKVARLICMMQDKDGNPYAGDSRMILGKVVKEAADMGYQIHVGPECEFFLFDCDESGHATTATDEQAGYLDISPLDTGENARRDMILTLEDMNFKIESSYHELAPGQHEIDFENDEAIRTADNIITFKMVVKIIARRHGKHATFLPKPDASLSGSGMHLNFKLYDQDGKNLFEDDQDENGMSELAYQFLAGVMKHADAITAVTNPIVNSYKRLVPGVMAPVYKVWSMDNPASIIHVNTTEPENRKLEIRFPDATANPYLAIAVCLEAGLDGIRNKLKPADISKDRLCAYTREQVEEMGYGHIPENLGSALEALEQDEVIKDVLGKDMAELFIRNKKKEWREYLKQVTSWEINEYLYKY